MRVKKISILGIILLDASSTFFSIILGFLLRFNFSIPASEYSNLIVLLVLTLPIRITSLYYHSVYRSISRYTSVRDLEKMVRSVVIAQVVIVASVLFFNFSDFPRSVLVIEPIVAMMFLGGIRLTGRIIKEYGHLMGNDTHLPNLLIFGAGDLGETVYRSIRSSRPPEYNIVGFIDDSPQKWHRHIHGLPIFGGRSLIPQLIETHKIDVIVVAINNARASLLRDLMDIYAESAHHRKVIFRIVPTIPDFLKSATHGKANFRNIELADLLPRKETRLDLKAISHIVEGKNILVTGAGGTIGSELCRQLIRFNPKALLMLEKNNTALFYIDRDMHRLAHKSKIVSIAGDVQDKNQLENLFQIHQPQIVFHAAAHKHVPLMESNPQEAIKNNTIATWLLAETALKYNAEKFLFISTDKAVHPSNIMGASKRLGEMVVRSMVGKGNTCFMSVRFGNVLGSSGSVVEIFKEQLLSGGPITVTHPEMTRFFMTTEEAVQLILQSCALATGGEIFVLNMGTPMKVVDLARNFIILNGLEPEIDIPINFIGIRAGEKLHEELFSPDEIQKDTGHPEIFMAVAEESNRAIINEQIAELKELSRMAEPQLLLKKVTEIIPSFRPFVVSKQNSVV